jgi:hypothetical protein
MGRFRRRGEAAPSAARQMSGQAEQVALAQRQDSPDFEPIAGVGLAQFAAVSRGIAAFGHDASKLGHVTASAGIPAQRWEIAARGWQDRIQGNHAVARRFNQFYREAWA